MEPPQEEEMKPQQPLQQQPLQQERQWRRVSSGLLAGAFASR
jgi:hypothetical protein